MRIGNILATLGIITGFIGILCLPLWNLNELPFIGESGYAKGGGWILIAQSGILKKPGLILVVLGGLLFGVAKMLPRKYWKTAEDLLEEEFEAGKKKNIK